MNELSVQTTADEKISLSLTDLTKIKFCSLGIDSFYVFDEEAKICHDYEKPRSQLNQTDFWISGDNDQMVKTNFDSHFRYTDIPLHDLSFIDLEILSRNSYPIKDRTKLNKIKEALRIPCQSVDESHLRDKEIEFLNSEVSISTDNQGNTVDFTEHGECQPVYLCVDEDTIPDNETIDLQANNTDTVKLDIIYKNCTNDCSDSKAVTDFEFELNLPTRLKGFIKIDNVSSDLCNEVTGVCGTRNSYLGDNCYILPKRKRVLIQVIEDKEKNFEYKRRQIPRAYDYSEAWKLMSLDILLKFGPFTRAITRQRRFLGLIMIAIWTAIALGIASRAFAQNRNNQRIGKEGFRVSDQRDQEIQDAIHRLEDNMRKIDENIILTLHTFSQTNQQNHGYRRILTQIYKEATRLQDRVEGIKRILYMYYNEKFVIQEASSCQPFIDELSTAYQQVQCETLENGFRMFVSNNTNQDLPSKLEGWWFHLTSNNLSLHKDFLLDWDTCGVFFRNESTENEVEQLLTNNTKGHLEIQNLKTKYRNLIGFSFDRTIEIIINLNMSYRYVSNTFCDLRVEFDDVSERLDILKKMNINVELESDNEVSGLITTTITNRMNALITPTKFSQISAAEEFEKWLVSDGLLAFAELVSALPFLIVFGTLIAVTRALAVIVKIAAIPLGLFGGLLGLFLSGNWLAYLIFAGFMLFMILGPIIIFYKSIKKGVYTCSG